MFVLFACGWGGRIRTHEMEESESSALPLGDTPILMLDKLSVNYMLSSIIKYLFIKNNYTKNLVFLQLILLKVI